MVAQQWAFIKNNLFFKIVKMVNFILCEFYLNFFKAWKKEELGDYTKSKESSFQNKHNYQE